ncbi:MAG: transposase [Candidatus Omnitrophota bacterium]
MNKLPARKPIRLKQYDYSQSGYYYVTICTYNRQKLFGDIADNYMIPNDIGKIIKNTWLQIPSHFVNVKLDEYVIMPNHIHGIINNVGAGLPRPKNVMVDTTNGRGNHAPTLGNIIAYFKYQSTKHVNNLQNTPGQKIWQRLFYDHIIRNEKLLNKIREYIINNPTRWDEGENNIRNGEDVLGSKINKI